MGYDLQLTGEMYNRWQDFAKDLNFSNNLANKLFSDLDKYYNEEERCYHNFYHIKECLNLFDKYIAYERYSRSNALFPGDIEHIKLALWFHDIVFDPTMKDNKEQTIAYIKNSLPAYRQNIYIPAINSLILASANDTPDLLSGNLAVMADVNLAVKLSADFEIFEKNIAKLRKEYEHQDDTTFYMENKFFLGRLIKRPNVFFTDYFKEHYTYLTTRNIISWLKKNRSK